MVEISGPILFSQQEAQNKIGTRVQCLTGFSDVPWKSVGTIIGIRNAKTNNPDDFYVLIRWELKENKFTIDQFAQNAYKKYIWEITDDPLTDPPYVPT
jgi:hypothetical protein